MARVDGRIQSIELEVRQDGDRLCFVDRNNSDRPGIAPTIRIRPGEVLRVRLFNRINDASILQKTTPPGHATSFPGIPGTPEYFDVVPGAYHDPTGNTNLHFHGLEVKPVPCGPGIAPGDDVLTTYFVPENELSPRGACVSAYEIADRMIIPRDCTGITRTFMARAKPRPCSDCPAPSWSRTPTTMRGGNTGLPIES